MKTATLPSPLEATLATIPDKRFFTIKETAEILEKSYNKTLDMFMKKDIEGIREGRRILVPRAAICAWITANWHTPDTTF